MEYGIADPYNTVRGVAVLDADEDSDFDLVYGNWEGPHRFFMNRDGRFEDVPAAMEVPSRIRTVIAADFDNDGYEEIFWNHIGQPNRLFKRSGDGSWTSVDPGPHSSLMGSSRNGRSRPEWRRRLELLVAHGESGAQKLSAYQWGECKFSPSHTSHSGWGSSKRRRGHALPRRTGAAPSHRCRERLSLPNGASGSLWARRK